MQATALCIGVLITVFTTECVAQHFTQNDKDEILRIHNSYRTNPEPKPLQDLAPMRWSSVMESKAQQWANRCNFNHPTSNDPEGYLGTEKLGQNIYVNTLRDVNLYKDGLKAWHDERDGYNLCTQSCSLPTCLHYTQLVASIGDPNIEVGCGVNFCNHITGFGHRGMVIVCDYNPLGNIQDRPPYQSAHCGATLPPGQQTQPPTQPAPQTTPQPSQTSGASSSETGDFLSSEECAEEERDDKRCRWFNYRGADKCTTRQFKRDFKELAELARELYRIRCPITCGLCDHACGGAKCTGNFQQMNYKTCQCECIDHFKQRTLPCDADNYNCDGSRGEDQFGCDSFLKRYSCFDRLDGIDLYTHCPQSCGICPKSKKRGISKYDKRTQLLMAVLKLL